MRRVIMLDEGLRILEEGIVKAKNILIGHPPKSLFSGEDYMKFYNCVYTMCSQRPPYEYSEELYERYKTALEESIVSIVLPSLNDKHDAYLLVDLLQMWANYKVMTKCLLGFFQYLDYHFVSRRHVPSLNDLALLCFHNLVCTKLYGKFRDAAISMINQERNGQQFQQDLLKNVLDFFVEIGEGKIDYYQTFEQVMLEDAASYYSRLASEMLCYKSYTDYIQKVAWFLIQERERAGRYLQQASLEKLLEIVKWKLMGETAQLLIEKQKAESHDTETYQDLLSKYAGMSIGEGSSVSLSKQWSILK
ncbi:cullin-1-like isoform X1 [Alnus glutinosa]|uniref:cullin-1-like isoform X1 n=1 Tax=Alnus glutinosa TaxID=3517 RepID=UPI002D795228|nr:cullin-1-like isoform X1 [Alnus glutinosa]